MAQRKATRVGINGFGRVGRCVMRIAADDPELEFVAINDLTDAKTLAHLYKYDSVHGRSSDPIEVSEDSLCIGSQEMQVLSERDPAKLPWRELGCEIVIESTGLFTKRPDAAKHLSAGARKVIITAPATEPDLTVALGVNDESYEPENHDVISNASCTTNCLAPIAKVLLQQFGMRRGWIPRSST
jgi:glyceraldehyde 3-phosphate dehydrogenase